MSAYYSTCIHNVYTIHILCVHVLLVHVHVYAHVHQIKFIILPCSSEYEYDRYGFKHEMFTESMTEDALQSVARRQVMMVDVCIKHNMHF